MPSWKKVITSGSNAMLSSVYTSGDVSGSASSIGSFGQVKAGTLSVTGNITTQGDIIAENYIVSSSVTYMTQSYSSGSTVFGNTSNDKHQFTGSLSMTGDVIPSTDATVDLGSDTKRFANLYTADIQLSNEQKGPNDIDGTTGKWTIQEGKNDLFLINRRTGEKFKFIIEQVE
tara:strand:+ start:336 stop:854 length:519 start_codon:yes stop_codon:yes gene_type:complete